MKKDAVGTYAGASTPGESTKEVEIPDSTRKKLYHAHGKFSAGKNLSLDRPLGVEPSVDSFEKPNKKMCDYVVQTLEDFLDASDSQRLKFALKYSRKPFPEELSEVWPTLSIDDWAEIYSQLEKRELDNVKAALSAYMANPRSYTLQIEENIYDLQRTIQAGEEYLSSVRKTSPLFANISKDLEAKVKLMKKTITPARSYVLEKVRVEPGVQAPAKGKTVKKRDARRG